MTGSIEEDLLIEDAELSTPESALDVVPDDAPAPARKAAAKKAPGRKAAPAPAPATVAPAAKKAPVEPFISAWVQPEGGVCPPSHPVKAKLASRLFHLPGMFAYDRTRPDRCFRDAEAATAEGFTQAKR
jgi:micrococcal nuclease